jgi:hypothetical protein
LIRTRAQGDEMCRRMHAAARLAVLDGEEEATAAITHGCGGAFRAAELPPTYFIGGFDPNATAAAHFVRNSSAAWLFERADGSVFVCAWWSSPASAPFYAANEPMDASAYIENALDVRLDASHLFKAYDVFNMLDASWEKPVASTGSPLLPLPRHPPPHPPVYIRGPPCPCPVPNKPLVPLNRQPTPQCIPPPLLHFS